MKTLVGVVLANDSKNYCIDKFIEMSRVVFTDVDVVFAVDRQGRVPFEEIYVSQLNQAAAFWATWCVYWGKGALKDYALDHGYDRLVWQGIDCFYEDKAQFDTLLDGQAEHKADIFGALVAGRNREDYPVCRYYVFSTTEQRWTKAQLEFDAQWFDGNAKPCPGYIGSDATVLSARALRTVTMDGYHHWHELQRGLGPEEYWMWSAISRHNLIPQVHTGIRPWHAHETGRTVRYPDGVTDLSSLSWT